MQTVETDIEDKYFFLKPRPWVDFFFPFFFRCLYAVLFFLVYWVFRKSELNVNKSFQAKEKSSKTEDVLFVGDSTISFPAQEYSFPYLFVESNQDKNVDIIARPSLNAEKLFSHIKTPLTEKNKKYDTIFVACFLNEIIDSGITVRQFKKSTILLIEFLQKQLKPNGKIIYIYGNFSLHPIVPNNYFRAYFDYKTKKFLSILKQNNWRNVEFSLLMNFQPLESRKFRRRFFYKDGLHFSKKGQRRLYKDLIANL